MILRVHSLRFIGLKASSETQGSPSVLSALCEAKGPVLALDGLKVGPSVELMGALFSWSLQSALRLSKISVPDALVGDIERHRRKLLAEERIRFRKAQKLKSVATKPRLSSESKYTIEGFSRSAPSPSRELLNEALILFSKPTSWRAFQEGSRLCTEVINEAHPSSNELAKIDGTAQILAQRWLRLMEVPGFEELNARRLWWPQAQKAS